MELTGTGRTPGRPAGPAGALFELIQRGRPERFEAFGEPGDVRRGHLLQHGPHLARTVLPEFAQHLLAERAEADLDLAAKLVELGTLRIRPTASIRSHRRLTEEGREARASPSERRFMDPPCSITIRARS